MAEMFHGFVDGQQFAIVGTVFLLGRVEFLGEGERLPGVVNMLLQYSAHGASGGIRDECKRRGWVGMCQ
jgi:hypothetical protein